MTTFKRMMLTFLLLAVVFSLPSGPLVDEAEAQKAPHCDIALWECLNWCDDFFGDPMGGFWCKEGCMIGWLLC